MRFKLREVSVVEQRKTDEMNLYKDWQKNQSTPAFQKLYTSMRPLLYKAAEKASYGSNIPMSAHQVWAAQNFYDALRTYKPSAGTALQTHIFNAVHQKAKRLNYLYQNLGHIPEPRAMQIGLYQNIFENLKEDLGREPSSAEVADKIGWGLKDVNKIQIEIKKDLALDITTEDKGIFESSIDEEILDYVYYELSPEEQLVYDYVFGRNGKARMVKANNKINFEGIATRVGFSASKVRALWTKVRLKVQKALHR
jgi:DNA-directed RNA polymerase specialized sigma subunit